MTCVITCLSILYDKYVNKETTLEPIDYNPKPKEALQQVPPTIKNSDEKTRVSNKNCLLKQKKNLNTVSSKLNSSKKIQTETFAIIINKVTAENKSATQSAAKEAIISRAEKQEEKPSTTETHKFQIQDVNAAKTVQSHSSPASHQPPLTLIDEKNPTVLLDNNADVSLTKIPKPTPSAAILKNPNSKSTNRKEKDANHKTASASVTRQSNVTENCTNFIVLNAMFVFSHLTNRSM